MTPNPQDYVSLELARKLMKAGIVFGESEEVWVRLIKKPFSKPLKYYKWKLAYRFDLHVDEVITYQGGHSPYRFGCSQACAVYLPAPSLNEILDRLPSEINTKGKTYFLYMVKEGWVFYYQEPWHGGHILCDAEAPTAPDAAAKMLLKIEREKENV